MFELEKNPEIQRLIQITKSNSGVSGPELAQAHMNLGRLLAEQMNFAPEDTTVVAVMRGGLFFAEGIYFQFGCKFQIYDPKHEIFRRPDTPNIILVDAVINTGKTIHNILQPDMAVACCVIHEKAVASLANQLYTVRVSKNSFVGANIQVQSGTVGPDTTSRLFNLI